MEPSVCAESGAFCLDYGADAVSVSLFVPLFNDIPGAKDFAGTTIALSGFHGMKLNADSHESMPMENNDIVLPLERGWKRNRIRLVGMMALAGCAFLCAARPAQTQQQAQHPEVLNPQTGLSVQSFEQVASRAQAAMDANQTDEAISLYEQAVALRPSFSEGWWELGTTFFDEGQIAAAHDAFLHFVSVEHRQPGPGFGMLGLTEFELRDYQKAIIAFERGRQLGLGGNAGFIERVYFEDGVANNYLGEPELAVKRLKYAANEIAYEHHDAPKDAVLANTELIDAIGLAALHIPKLPTEIPADKKELIREAGNAQAMIALDDQVTAGEELKQFVALYPNEPGVHYMYGVYLLKEDPESAVGEFVHETEVAPKQPPAYIQVALLDLKNGDYQQGLKYVQQAIALAPGNFIAHVACGRLWLNLNNTDKAVMELRTAVKLSPTSPDAHFALSRALFRAGKKPEAAKEEAEFERLKALADKAVKE
jgi:tetratricopeptide (TPR) repeat protein